MKKNILLSLFTLFFCLSFTSAQVVNKTNHPLSGSLLLTLEAGTNYAFTDYEKTNFGLSLLGGLEYYLPTQSKSIFGFKTNIGQQYISGNENFLGLPNTFNTEIRNAGFGLIYSYAINSSIFPFISVGGSYLWYTFESKNEPSRFYDFSNGGEETSLAYNIDGGFKFKISDGIGLSTRIGYHFIANDNIDAIKTGEFEDFYISASFGLAFSLFVEDVDSDGDGIVDEKDSCPGLAEDMDGFQDEDGCPDEDNDGDGIKDYDDMCPNIKEDIDGFQDEDGCPDEDNDGDGINDIEDSCPDKKEDIDGFQDEDGCPDIDNDGDGILDNEDLCKNEAETFNGFEDTDGCPDELPKPKYVEPIVKDKKIDKPKTETKPKQDLSGAPSSIILHSEATFNSNTGQIKSSAYSRLNEIADQLSKYPTAIWRIEAHTDKQNSVMEAVTLTKQQADAIMNYLSSKGISSSNIQSVGIGDSSPISSNSSVYGRMKNRRVVIRRVN